MREPMDSSPPPSSKDEPSSSPEQADDELVRRWAGGDRDAGEALIRRHLDAVYGVFAGKVATAIDDLVQQTFMACVQQRDRLPNVVSFRAYLLGIARHTLYQWYRVARRERGVLDPDPTSIDGRVPVTGGYSRNMLQDRVCRAVAELPLDTRLLVEMFYFEGLSAVELGAVFDCNPATLRSRLMAARKTLRSLLGDETFEDDLSRCRASARGR